MKLLDFFTSTRRPAAGIPALAADEVRKRLLSLNRPTAPFQIIDGATENVELIAEWKIADANWHELFAKSGLAKAFKIYLKFDPEAHVVRAMDREYSISWSAGVPTLSLAINGFKGQKQSVEFGSAYAYTETLAPGEVYNYHFNTKEMKKPIQDVVTTCGWIYKGVAFGKL